MKYSDLKLGDISNVFRGISIPRDRTSVDFEIPYLHYGDIYKIYNNYLDVSKEIKSIIKIKSNEKIKEYQYLQSDDIVINLTSENYEDLGKSIYIDNKDNKLVAGMETTIIRFNKSIKHSPLFLKYYFDTSFFYNDILQYVRGMKVFRVNPKDLLRAKLPNIVLNQQIKIAEYIKNLDDKIEINNKINKNLETLAQILYKHWFVDFEFPNENGEPYKSSGGEMVDSELGLIPKGWEILNLEDRFAFERGIEPGSKNYQQVKDSDSIPFYRVGDLNQKSELFVNKALVKAKIVYEDDILVSFDGAIGRIGIGFSGAYSTGLRKVYDKDKKISNSFVYNMMKSSHIQETMAAHANGTTILHAGSSIPFLKIAFDKSIVESYEYSVNPIFEKIIEIIKEIQKLAEIRDTLLPKLMNGEIEVPV